MKYEVQLPPLGEDAEDTASVTFWLASKGEDLKENDDLLELSTDKAAFIVPCPKDGKLVELRVGEGDEVAVGDVICVLEA